jgi:hypothetical protein
MISPSNTTIVSAAITTALLVIVLATPLAFCTAIYSAVWVGVKWVGNFHLWDELLFQKRSLPIPVTVFAWAKQMQVYNKPCIKNKYEKDH